jgi:formylglycine-generating enzyme required for sulfatase activity
VEAEVTDDEVTIDLDELGRLSKEPIPRAKGAGQVSVAVGDVLLDRYRLVALIGEGGMSRVYKATDSGTIARAEPDSFIAVKVLTRPINEDFGPFSAFRNEVQKLRGLAHPNIVRTFDCDRDGSTVFVTMEYLDGPSLYSKLRSGATAAATPSGLGRDEARRIIFAIADALDYAHRNGVVHGDLKPGNVIVIDPTEIKVIDFEISSWVGRSKPALDRRDAAQSSPAVTPRYASPQLMTRQIPEPADDVYALACVAYELLTGTHPFDAGAGAEPAKFPPPRRAELSSAQYAALVHGLQRDRRKRTSTVRQFVKEFSAQERGGIWKSAAVARAIGLSTAVFLIAAVVWFFARHAPAPAPVAVMPSPAAPNPGTVVHDCPTCPGMTVLRTGRFQQGSARAESGSAPFEKPLHWVTIGRPLAMSTNAVTVDEFQQFIAATGRDMQGCDTYDGEWKHRPTNSWKNPGFEQSGTHPVTCVSWNDAEAYAGWLSTKTGHRYRLPSASEWEYAARSGGDAVQPWNSDGSGACTNANVADGSAARRYPGWSAFGCDDGYVYTAPVGSFKTNAFGLNDMLGNVFQWTKDCWHADYAGAPNDGSARVDGNCAEHELRGGSWFSTPAYVRANYRNHFGADYRTSSVGIRLVRDVEQ